MFSEPFRVKQGVRQGDPLSCALFNLAIEPLACRIRGDPNIKGFSVPGLIDKLAIKLFANDTNLYLSREDNLQTVQGILDEWCEISGAKFNQEKTEIIPIGREEHRHNVVATRKLSPRDPTPLPEGTRIARDGDAVRMLGAWIGNRIEDITPWEPIINKINTKLGRWKRTHPSLNGRKIITQMIVVSSAMHSYRHARVGACVAAFVRSHLHARVCARSRVPFHIKYSSLRPSL